MSGRRGIGNRGSGTRGIGRRRLAVVGTGVLCLSGLAGGYLAAPAFAESAAAEAAHRTPLVPGTACTITAKACVDLDTNRAWLFKDGKVIRGPVKIASGGDGDETPTGHSLRVYRKEADHKSQEFPLDNGQPAPMPWSVFFQDGGIAFHGGDLDDETAGCVRLGDADAKAWFDYLQVGDQVQVVKAEEELKARSGEVSHDAAYDEDDGDDEDSE
jgi:hypothetical protein